MKRIKIIFLGLLIVEQLLVNKVRANESMITLRCETTERVISKIGLPDSEKPDNYDHSSPFNFILTVTQITAGGTILEIEPESDYLKKYTDRANDEYRFVNGRCIEVDYGKDIFPDNQCLSKLTIDKNFIRGSKNIIQSSPKHRWDSKEELEISRIDGRIHWSLEFLGREITPHGSEANNSTRRLTERVGKCQKVQREF